MQASPSPCQTMPIFSIFFWPRRWMKQTASGFSRTTRRNFTAGGLLKRIERLEQFEPLKHRYATQGRLKVCTDGALASVTWPPHEETRSFMNSTKCSRRLHCYEYQRHPAPARGLGFRTPAPAHRRGRARSGRQSVRLDHLQRLAFVYPARFRQRPRDGEKTERQIRRTGRRRPDSGGRGVAGDEN